MLKALILVGCNLSAIRESIPPTAEVAPDASDGWELVAPGFERRYIQPDGLGALAAVVIHRIDPNQFEFRAHLSPGRPLSLNHWRQQLPSAIAFINANFFDQFNNHVGLVVSDGTAYGASYVNRGGMFAVQNGVPRVQSLIVTPYDGAPLEQAVQGFPMLVTDGRPTVQTAPGDRSTRRTVVAQDGQGRILWISTTLVGMTLDQMAAFLVSSGLDVVNALNLDGGGSMMLYAPGADLPSFDPVPVVLALYPKRLDLTSWLPAALLPYTENPPRPYQSPPR